jgi:hypothetical protein
MKYFTCSKSKWNSMLVQNPISDMKIHSNCIIHALMKHALK